MQRSHFMMDIYKSLTLQEAAESGGEIRDEVGDAAKEEDQKAILAPTCSAPSCRSPRPTC